MHLSYGEASDLFQLSFPNGQADQNWVYLGKTTFKFTNLKISRENTRVIPVATVVFNDDRTFVTDEETGEVHIITPKEAEQKNLYLTRVFDSIRRGY